MQFLGIHLAERNQHDQSVDLFLRKRIEPNSPVRVERGGDEGAQPVDDHTRAVVGEPEIANNRVPSALFRTRRKIPLSCVVVDYFRPGQPWQPRLVSPHPLERS